MAKKVILYGNKDCPDCVLLKDLFDKEGIRYGYVDVLAGLAHMKKFLNLRDSHPDIFKSVVENQKIGIPAVVVDDQLVFAEIKIDQDFDLTPFRQ